MEKVSLLSLENISVLTPTPDYKKRSLPAALSEQTSDQSPLIK